MSDGIWRVQISFDEDETHTRATLRAEMRDAAVLTASGDAFRNPKDSNQPLIGEEIAAARGLIALGTQLLQEAASRIERETHRPAHVAP